MRPEIREKGGLFVMELSVHTNERLKELQSLPLDRQQYEKGYMDGLTTFSTEVAPELSALEAERDALRAELIEVLEKAASCREHDTRCGDCPYFHNSCGGCPSKLSADEAVRRLAVLRGD